MRTLRHRFYGDIAEAPTVGGYLMSEWRPRGGYLIHRVTNHGQRGGLGRSMHLLLILAVERVSVAEARQGPLWLMQWDSRGKRQS